jgi:hypothetical protein
MTLNIVDDSIGAGDKIQILAGDNIPQNVAALFTLPITLIASERTLTGVKTLASNGIVKVTNLDLQNGYGNLTIVQGDKVVWLQLYNQEKCEEMQRHSQNLASALGEPTQYLPNIYTGCYAKFEKPALSAQTALSNSSPIAPAPVVPTAVPAVVSPDLLRPNFVFHPKMDSYGGDLKPDVTSYKNQPAEIYRACVERPGCIGFNTNGYLKQKIEPQLYQWTEDPTVGLVTFDPELKTYTGLRHELLSDNSQFLPAVRTNLQNAYVQENIQSVRQRRTSAEMRQFRGNMDAYVTKTVNDALAYLKAEPVKSIELAQKLGFAKAASDDPQAPKIDVTPGLTTWVRQLAEAHQTMPTAAKVGAQVTQFSRNNGQLVLGLLLLAGAGVGGWYLWRQRKRNTE